MFDVVAIGELLIDFVQTEVSNTECPVFQANPGGAPCNVLAMLQKLGLKTAFIGKVGNDIFGHRLKSVLSEIGINIESLVFDEDTRTTLAFVAIDELGDRSFSFFRNPGADMMLSRYDINKNVIDSCRALHFGTLSMTHKNPEEATKTAIDIAKSNGAIISFDPNLRPPLWTNLDIARQQMDYGCSVSDIVKIEENELTFLMECADKEKALDMFREKYRNIKMLTVTAGRNGSKAFFGDVKAEKPTFLDVKTIDTTGAGDTFCACCLNWYIKNIHRNDINAEELGDLLTFANAAASIVTTRKGALLSMPEISEINNLIKTYKNGE